MRARVQRFGLRHQSLRLGGIFRGHCTRRAGDQGLWLGLNSGQSLRPNEARSDEHAGAEKQRGKRGRPHPKQRRAARARRRGTQLRLEPTPDGGHVLTALVVAEGMLRDLGQAPAAHAPSSANAGTKCSVR